MKKDDLYVFYNNISKEIKNNEDNERYMKYFFNSFLAGDTSVYHKSIAEFKNFDNEWIEKLEELLPSIDKIISQPKSTLRYDEEIIIIEKAKKVTSTSIRHLAANSHLIKDIDDNGDIIPNKILTANPEVEYGIYENRFIMTLINRLVTFVGNRYEVIKSNIQSYEKKHINLTSNFDFNNNNVNLNIDMVVKSEADDSELKQRNEKLFARVTKLFQTVHGFLTSPFMRELAGKKPVKPPIMKTNIILKNPDFRNAYKLWLFLDKYNALVYDVDVQEKDLDLDPKFVASLNELALLSYAYIRYNQESRKEEYASKQSVEYTRKATKIVRVHPKDVVDNPDAIAMEDNTINEYYLDQNQKLFKKTLLDLLGDNISYEDALKTAMKQTLDITNSLYKSVFELNPQLRSEVENMFAKTDLEKSLAEAKKKAEIAKIIRETKEADFKETIDLEKQQLEIIHAISSEMLEKAKRRKKKIKDEVDKVKVVVVDQETITDPGELNERKIQVLKTIENLAQLKKDLYEEQKQFNEELEKIVDQELIAAEKERAKLEREELKRKMEEERERALERERQMYRETRDKIRAKYKELQEQIIRAEAERREAEIKKLQEQFRIRREEEIEKLKAKVQNIG